MPHCHPSFWAPQVSSRARPGGTSPTSLNGVVREIYATDGMRGFYRGLAPNFMKAVPSVAISYLIFEKSKAAMAAHLAQPEGVA